jgi:hypothetical protein
VFVASSEKQPFQTFQPFHRYAPFQSFKAGAGSQFKIRFGGGNFHVSRILETSK